MSGAKGLTGPDELARACGDAMMAEDAASRGLGIELNHVAPGSATTAMTIRDTMLNGHGICHGGFIFTLADTAFAVACNSYNERCVAASADISFLKPAARGDVLSAVATETFRRGRNGIYDVTVATQVGETIAMFRGKSRSIGGRLVETGEAEERT